jgi:uncharacterized coiled-coil protein SlyX
MITKRNLVLVALITFCLAITMFRVLPIFSSGVGVYDPWMDVNDDGKIDGKDVALVCLDFGTGGQLINKTELLIEVNNTYTQLLNTIDSCNASLIDLQGRVTALESITLPMNDTISTLQSRIDTLNASLLDIVSRTDSLTASVIDIQFRTTSLENRTYTLEGEVAQLQTNVTMLQENIASLNSTVTWLQTAVNTLQTNFALMNSSLTTLQSVVDNLTARVSALEGNFSVTNLDLAPSAIPFNLTYNISHQFTTETASFVDMPYTSVTLTLNRTSQLLIMFSADAGMTAASVNENAYIYCQATVNGTAATPGTIELTPRLSVENGYPNTHSHRIVEGACSFNFYYGPVNAGTYTIKIRWYLSATGTGDVWNRTLEVIGLPA